MRKGHIIMKELHKSPWKMGICEVWQKSNETISLFTYFFFQTSKCYPLENMSLGQLRTDVNTFGSSTGSLQPVWSSACPLHPLDVFYKDVLKRPSKASFVWEQTMQTNGCFIMSTPHVTLSSPSQNVWPQKVSLCSPAPPFTWQPLWVFPFS